MSWQSPMPGDGSTKVSSESPVCLNVQLTDPINKKGSGIINGSEEVKLHVSCLTYYRKLTGPACSLGGAVLLFFKSILI